MNFCGYDIILLCIYQSFVAGQYLVGKNLYHSHHDMTKEFRMLAQVYPNRTHLYSIGTSAEGRDLWVLSLSSHDPHKHLPMRPEISLVGNMHGDEAVGKELLLYLAVYLVEFYEYDPLIREIMDNSRIHILPSMNPDGFALSIEGTCDGIVGRGNAKKIDLNRNFPDFWESNDVEREPETKAVMAWLETVPFALAANFHGGTLVANYPFDNNKDGMLRYSEAPDDDVLKHLALTYSKSHPKMYVGHSATCGDSGETFVEGITNGADWYPVRGSLQDYQYAFKGIMATTLEISCCKYPKADTLSEFWQENRLSILEYMRQANRGVRGFIKDSITGAGIRAMIHIHGRRMRFFTSHHGEYYRILLPGIYIITVQSASGFYEPKSVPFTVPKDRLLIELNITLDYAIRPHTSKVQIHTSTVSKKPTKSFNLTASTYHDRATTVPKMKESIAKYSTETVTTAARNEPAIFSIPVKTTVTSHLRVETRTVQSTTEQITSTVTEEENIEVKGTNFIDSYPTTLKATPSHNVNSMTPFAALSRIKDDPINSRVANGGYCTKVFCYFPVTFTLFILVFLFHDIF